jgi:hypothetical protein
MSEQGDTIDWNAYLDAMGTLIACPFPPLIARPPSRS